MTWLKFRYKRKERLPAPHYLYPQMTQISQMFQRHKVTKDVAW